MAIFNSYVSLPEGIRNTHTHGFATGAMSREVCHLVLHQIFAISSRVWLLMAREKSDTQRFSVLERRAQISNCGELWL